MISLFIGLVMLSINQPTNLPIRLDTCRPSIFQGTCLLRITVPQPVLRDRQHAMAPNGL